MLWEWFQLGGPVMYPLLACSVIAMTVVTERFLFWSQLRKEQDPAGVQKVLTLAQQGKIAEAQSAGRSLRDPVARVLTRGLEHWPSAVTGVSSSSKPDSERSSPRTSSMMSSIVTRPEVAPNSSTSITMYDAAACMTSSTRAIEACSDSNGTVRIRSRARRPEAPRTRAALRSEMWR